MELDIQVTNRGGIHFVRQDGTPLVTLHHHDIALLYALRTAGVHPSSILVSRTLPPLLGVGF